MILDRTLKAREKLLESLPVTGEVLRGSLLDRIVHHTSGCRSARAVPFWARKRSNKISELVFTHLPYHGARLAPTVLGPQKVLRSQFVSETLPIMPVLSHPPTPPPPSMGWGSWVGMTVAVRTNIPYRMHLPTWRPPHPLGQARAS
jgi:hypothetical protein